LFIFWLGSYVFAQSWSWTSTYASSVTGITGVYYHIQLVG
jgi:hypothetical protein